MQRIPISRAVRPTRIAISPRFAIRSRRNIGSPSQRDVSVLLRRARLPLRSKHGKRVDDSGAGLRRFDYIVDVAHPRSDVRIREPVPVVADKLVLMLHRVVGSFEFFLVDNLDSLLRSHDGDLRGGPSEVEIPADVLRTHDVVCAAVRLSRDDRDLRDGRLAEGEQELCAVADNAVVFLLLPGKESGDVYEREQWNVEAVAESNEPRTFDRRIDVERARLNLRLVSDDANGSPLETSKADDDVLGPLFVNFEPRVVVDDPPDDVPYVIWFVGFLRHDLPEFRVRPGRLVVGRDDRRIVHVVRRQIAQEFSDQPESRFLVRSGEVGDAALRGMGRRAAEILERDILSGHGLDDLRTSDEHVRGPFRHDDEIRHRGAVHRASRAGTEDRTDLWDDTRCEDVPEENLRVTTEADDALLDPRASAVVQADDRCADLHRRVHDLDNLVRMHLPEAPAEHGEVL